MNEHGSGLLSRLLSSLFRVYQSHFRRIAHVPAMVTDPRPSNQLFPFIFHHLSFGCCFFYPAAKARRPFFHGQGKVNPGVIFQICFPFIVFSLYFHSRTVYINSRIFIVARQFIQALFSFFC